MNKCYNRIVWKNYPSDKTPLNEQNLNKIDIATDEVDNRVISLDATKFDKSEAQLLVKYIEYDEDTGIFKITHYNGASYTIDTLLEKLAINFDYDYQTQRLIITLSDGTAKYVDLSALITQYEFLDSETVAFTVDNSGKVTAKVKEGSIQEKHLRPNYLADIKVEVAKAEASATAADASEKAAKKSENAAKASEIAASASEANASESASNSEDSATKSGQKAAEAAASASAASTSASNAANSASTATEKANEAAISASNASYSASTASVKSSEASASASNSETYAKQSQSYAVGTGGVRPGEEQDNAKYYYEQTKQISQSPNGLIPKGNATFADLSNPANQETGYMFNISDSFVSDERFTDGGGIFYGAGSNVFYTVDGKWDVMAASMVSGVKGEAEAEYRQGFVSITKEDIGVENATENVAGIVKPDGITITVDDDGTIHGSSSVDTATEEKAGIVKPDGITITVDEDGTISGAEKEFTGTKDEVDQAILSGEIKDGMIVNIINDGVYIFKNENLKKIADSSSVFDTKDNTVTFDSGDNLNPVSPTDVELITSGETHSSLFHKFSITAKNVRYLIKMLGSADISGIGDGTVTGAISELNTGMYPVAASGNYQGIVINHGSGLAVFVNIPTQPPVYGMKYTVTCTRAGVYGIGWSTAGKIQYVLSGHRLLIVIPISGNFANTNYIGHLGTADLIIEYN